MTESFLSAVILLLLVLDPFGALPVFLSVMRPVAAQRRTRVALRESAIAFGILLAFMFAGRAFLRVMHLTEQSLEVAGGVILLVIAMRMVFTHTETEAAQPMVEPLIVPLAVPLMAGPSAMATVLLLASRDPQHLGRWVLALLVAMGVSCIVLLSADRLRHWLGDAVIAAVEKLMGLVLTAVAMQMILEGVRRYFFLPA